MRRVFTFLGAALCLAAVAPARAQAPDMFKDQDPGHWAYAAMESLRSKGIVIGYPDGYFRGKRTLTRYEFAVALDRALKTIGTQTGPAGPQGEKGDKGTPGDKGDTGATGAPGMTPEEVQNLRRLTQEFKDELTALGNNMTAVNRRIDGLAKDITDIKGILSKLPTIYGGAFVGIRSDNVSGNYVDKDGRVNTLGNTQAVVHAFELGVKANVAGGATIDAAIDVDNYLNYLGGSFGRGIGFNGPFAPGPPALSSAVPSDTRLRKLEVNTPFGAVGRGGKITLGRFGKAFSHLTLMKPDFDTYLNNPFVDDGKYYMDGADITTKFGSVSFEVLGAQLISNQGSTGGPVNSPIAGTSLTNIAGIGGGPRLFVNGNKPIAQANQGQMSVDQLIGVRGGIDIRQLKDGHINFTALETAQTGAAPTFGGIGYNGVMVLGSDFGFKLSDTISVSGEWGKTITHTGRNTAVGTHQNNAFNLNAGFKFGSLDVTAGYRYIDPLFYAPGYWGRIGNWMNPTNIQGPTFRAKYQLSSMLGVNVGGDFYEAARNRAGVGGLSKNDEINRILVGLKLGLTKKFQTTVDWEGVYWKLQGLHSGLPGQGVGTSHPTEHYVTLGTGYHLTEATLLSLMYQIGAFDGHGAMSEGGTGTRNTYNAFAASAKVAF